MAVANLNVKINSSSEICYFFALMLKSDDFLTFVQKATILADSTVIKHFSKGKLSKKKWLNICLSLPWFHDLNFT